jgi:peptidoglycan/xylan/chitin deacetylase (PgdA/CDA1 family)
MRDGALILTYHAVEPGPAPLCLDRALFSEHLDCLEECGARVLTISQLAAALRAGQIPGRAVAITFDDGFASVAHEAAPLLLERGIPATVFCVAGYLGKQNDWPTQPPRSPRRPLASRDELAELARSGFEIGSHGLDHAPLANESARVLDRELRESRAVLGDATGVAVESFAYPYGLRPDEAAQPLVERTYRAACTTSFGSVTPRTDPFALPRIDAHYLRRPALLRRAVLGTLGPYLLLRRVGAGTRRALVKDYARPAAA